MKRVWHCTVWVMCLAVWVVPGMTAAPGTRKVVIDTDPGTDDAMAILLALNSPETRSKSADGGGGKRRVEQGFENALKLVSLAGRCDVLVAKGASHPLVQRLITAEFFHGANGLGNVELPASACQAEASFAPDLIIKLVHQYPHEITLVPVGPLTNIALALRKDPAIVPLVKEVVLMGGGISGGNATAAAEANIYNDPEAARAVFEAGWPLTMVGLNVAEKTLFTRADLDRLARTRGRQDDFAVGALSFMLEPGEQAGRRRDANVRPAGGGCGD